MDKARELAEKIDSKIGLLPKEFPLAKDAVASLIREAVRPLVEAAEGVDELMTEERIEGECWFCLRPDGHHSDSCPVNDLRSALEGWK